MWIADEALAGDRDVAEWVLLSAISRVLVEPSLLTIPRSQLILS